MSGFKLNIGGGKAGGNGNETTGGNATPVGKPETPAPIAPGKFVIKRMSPSGSETIAGSGASQTEQDASGVKALLEGLKFDGSKSATAPAPKPAMHIPGVNTAVAPALPLAMADITAEAYQFPTQTDGMNTATVEGFKENLDLLKNSFDKKDLIAPVIRRIMSDLDNHPEFEEVMLPEDFGMMVKAMRESYGIALIKKETKGKAGGSKKAPPAPGNMDMGALANILMSVGGKK